jgi:hypothetical protein
MANRVHRSHSRGPFEAFLKTVSPYKLYRCHDCNWRGWLRPSADGRVAVRGSWRTVFFVFVTGLLLGLLFATYVMYRTGP